MNSSYPLLKVHKLSIHHELLSGEKHAIVEDISFSIDPGHRFALVGESGSGKTMISKAIASFLPKKCKIYAGEVLFDNIDVSTLSQKEVQKLRGKRISYIPQNAIGALTPSLKVGYQLIEPLMYHLNLTKEEALDKALSLLENVKIANPKRCLSLYPFELSGGMRQRVVIAIALSCKPDLIIADEPTTALDSVSQWKVLSILNDLSKEYRSSLLLITHNLSIVPELCEHVAVMKSGKIVEMGSVHKVFSNPTHTYTKKLLSSFTKIPRTDTTQEQNPSPSQRSYSPSLEDSAVQSIKILEEPVAT
ncbi:ABC transporter ATP-binding protein [Chlamydiifrater phoenicopteri]|uniref:ABC transporter ATP-binding protein n=1 Tax=Chlamydiifrater phoenicopteri TaxID=2681469 RepID=UPI001FE2591C|nr:ABC transporter ATP-binding protein [Chlamydiifrater phoenicopteri]